MSHEFTCRVYYEDTDLAGIVYYANYFKFIERARSEWVRAAGIDQKQLKDESGIVFAVRQVHADYLKPAAFDDILRVETALNTLTPARIVLSQAIWREEMQLFDSTVTLVCLDETGRPKRLPADICRRLQA
ncbi:tol-pal system-associated acyl-CoA thioesterase [Litoreibacter roseus]|uniref:Tol-pal system-associated acyl-CoA thioesterase n=1 Tax=Litoreibacter roseus TaxID=2601869 RepID=A0A6N6JJL3_9RHOB|nr:tol-pal system-associated acyl-CoA thioesterase [Litoreibacter roseus]GFE65382.1 tol-pal system-associated acyl-CoA thioesterase [Litoreibacter roseus]